MFLLFVSNNCCNVLFFLDILILYNVNFCGTMVKDNTIKRTRRRNKKTSSRAR